MIIDTTNRRNYRFLLLFGVFFSLNFFKTYADPVDNIYKSKVKNSSNVRNVVKAKNNISRNGLKKLRPIDQKNSLYNKIKGKSLIDTKYHNGLLRKMDNNYEEVKNYKNNIFQKWNINQIEDDLDDQYFYMDDYRSRLHPFHDYVFYDHYLSEMQKSKKDHHSFRKFLHNFRLHLSCGGGASFDRTNIVGYFFSDNGNYYLSPLFFNQVNHNAYEIGWFGEPYKKVPKTISRNEYAVLDSGEKIYTGWMKSLNFIALGLSYDVYKRLRFEIDFNFKGNYLPKLKRHYQVESNKTVLHSKATPENIDVISLPKKNFFSSDLDFLIGAKIINNTFWSMILNFKIYGSFFYNNFKIVEGSAVHGLYNFYPGFGTGITLEKHLSDYISLFTKGMFGVTKFGWSDQDKDSKCKIAHWLSSFSLDFGINFTSSYIDKCELDENCKIKEVHIHNSKEYRGLSKWQYKSPYGKVIHSAK